MLGQQAGEADTGIATLRAHNGKIVSRTKTKRQLLVELSPKLETRRAVESFYAEFEKDINAWEEANVRASE